ncbi:MAG: PilZ domain-containing protein [Candidatus Omnitrophica bacterium]|nr:PilZ domain-containing protein [Candidatus Omnitrophota bacterium]
MKKKILEIFGLSKKKSHRPSQRLAPRARAMNLIKISLSDGSSFQSISNIVNISETGLQFTCYERVQPDQDIRMLINVPEAHEDIGIEGRLVWIKSKPAAKGVYVAGVQFKNIPDKTLQVVRKMVNGNFS